LREDRGYLLLADCYYRARYYDSGIGRFISEDPIGFVGGDVVFYGYTLNGPTNFTDPSGMSGQAAAAATATAASSARSGFQVIQGGRAAAGGASAGSAVVTALEAVALIYYEVKLAGSLSHTIQAINAENQTYMQQMQAEGTLNRLLLKQANEKQCEYDNYKKRCNQPPPPGLGPCEKKLWQLQRNIDCRDMRFAWDRKWQPGRHDTDLLQLTSGIQKQQTWIQSNCQ